MFKSIFKAVAVSAVAAFFSIGCGDGGGGNPAGGGGGGSLTITGLPSGQWSVYVFPAGTDISDGMKYLGSMDKAEASNYGANNGNVSPLFRVEAGGGPSPNSFWTGSGNRTVAIQALTGTPIYRATVNFSNGNATVPFSSFTLVMGEGGNPVDPPDNPGGGGSTFTDSRDNKSYKKVVIGTQTWMAENLNYAASGSRCFGDGGKEVVVGSDFFYLSDAEVQANCAKYGRLYDWATAMTACPAGWRLPSDAEWTTLENYAGAETYDYEGKKLKATSGWPKSPYAEVGTDEYGFSALPGGYGASVLWFNIGEDGAWWTATETGNTEAWFRTMSYESNYVYRSNEYYEKDWLMSVRCVQDGSTTPTPTTYTVTFNYNYSGSTNTTATTGTDGKLASLPTPTRSGYTFDGWYTAATGGTAVTVSNVYSANTTIYARWTGGSVTPPSGSTFTDSRDNKSYKKVVIGTQTWMAENLNYDVEGSMCSGGNPENCTKYGRLYDWETALTVCPAGWHLSSDAEWTALTGTVGVLAVPNLRSKTGWNDIGGVPVPESTDEYGFSALPGGFGASGGYLSTGSYGYWWCATENDALRARSRSIGGSAVLVVSVDAPKSHLLSVRCVAD
jgi:uncharacterized protein (TIGR02145 family)/uncharacterized repeat protein (TIGR02543 family)